MFLRKKEYEALLKRILDLESKVERLSRLENSVLEQTHKTDEKALAYKDVIEEWLNGGKK